MLTRLDGVGLIIATVTLLGFSLALLAWIWVAVDRSPYTFSQTILYFPCFLLNRMIWRTRVIGRWELPPDEGAVVICNHVSPVDPFYVQLVPGRAVHWLVAKEYFHLPLVGWFLRGTRAIPTRRAGSDTAAVKQAIRHASANGLVGMLPEGRINDTGQLLLPGRPGAAQVALASRVRVVPCFIQGAPYDGTFWGCLFMPAQVRLYIGKPIDISEYFDQPRTAEVLRKVTMQFLKEIATLAGRPDYEPHLAGRRWSRNP